MKTTRVNLFLGATFLLAAVSSIHAETINVGGVIKWEVHPHFNYTDWAKNTSAKVGDSLLFTYNAKIHDVRKVTAEQYTACDKQNYLELWTSGADTVLLNSSGTWYFLCSKAQHCSQGQKFSIDIVSSGPVAASSPSTSPSPSPSRSRPQPHSPHTSLSPSSFTSPGPSPSSSTSPGPSPSSSTSPSPSPSSSTSPSPSPSSSTSPSPSPSSSTSPSPPPSPSTSPSPPPSPSTSPSPPPSSSTSPSPPPSRSSTQPPSPHPSSAASLLPFLAGLITLAAVVASFTVSV